MGRTSNSRRGAVPVRPVCLAGPGDLAVSLASTLTYNLYDAMHVIDVSRVLCDLPITKSMPS